MFGYVTPCKMELKIKDYEKFRAYYCGLCSAIKKNFGQLPRVVLNYDMTFLAALIDSLNDDNRSFIKSRCIVHPLKKRLMIIDNKALDYASFCNVSLAYYKLLDDVNDNNSIKAKLFSKMLLTYIKKDTSLKDVNNKIKSSLNELNVMERNENTTNLDELAHPFADLTGFIISHYHRDSEFCEPLYWLGYNLGKWIYIIDAWDDLEKDMHQKKFNAINCVFNTANLSYDRFKKLAEKRIDYLLTTCAKESFYNLTKLDLKKNKELLYNILQLGLLDKMNSIFGRSELNNERSI